MTTVTTATEATLVPFLGKSNHNSEIFPRKSCYNRYCPIKNKRYSNSSNTSLKNSSNNIDSTSNMTEIPSSNSHISRNGNIVTRATPTQFAARFHSKFRLDSSGQVGTRRRTQLVHRRCGLGKHSKWGTPLRNSLCGAQRGVARRANHHHSRCADDRCALKNQLSEFSSRVSNGTDWWLWLCVRLVHHHTCGGGGHAMSIWKPGVRRASWAPPPDPWARTPSAGS